MLNHEKSIYKINFHEIGFFFSLVKTLSVSFAGNYIILKDHCYLKLKRQNPNEKLNSPKPFILEKVINKGFLNPYFIRKLVKH